MNRNIVVTTHCVKCFLIAVRLCLLLELYECGSGLKSRDFSFVCETTQCRISKGFPHPHFYRNNTHTKSLENFPFKPKGVKGKYTVKKRILRFENIFWHCWDERVKSCIIMQFEIIYFKGKLFTSI